MTKPSEGSKEFVLQVHYGMVHNHIEYVEGSSGGRNGGLNVTLTKDPYKATYRNEKEARDWAKRILKDGNGTSTWKIVVIPLSAIDNEIKELEER